VVYFVLALFSPAPYLEVLRHLTEGLRDLGRWGSWRMPLVAEIGDITRFATARKLCAWAELIPQVRNSDRTVRHGHITKQGSAAVRWVLTEAAQRAKTQSPFARFYAQCVHRRGTQIATVAVARKLLARSFHVLNQVHATTTTSGEGQPAGCAR
jgi:hypothetical protein